MPRSTMRSPRTTHPGYRNRNDQVVVRATDLPGNDHLQRIYVLRCNRCCVEYGANGSDIFQRRCPKCGGGRPGLKYK
jgi:rRNA maturation endonuclease Nob1